MTSDSGIPNDLSKKAVSQVESISTLSEADSIKSVSHAQDNSVLPEAEVQAVLRYLKLIAVVNLSNIVDLNSVDSPSPEPTVNQNIQVLLKSEEGRLLLILPTEAQVPPSENSWSVIWQQLKLRLLGSLRFLEANTTVHLMAGDRLLDVRQLQQLAESLSEVQLLLKSVATSRRQTAIAAVTAGYSVEQLQPQTSLLSASKTTASAPEALYQVMTVRSGVEIRHSGSIIILGDVNPGGIVVADGDILVWGRIRGIAHAGASGNRQCLIMALQMEPTQLRIADAVARAPEKSPMQFYPEVAYITPEGIRIAKATDFSRTQLSRIYQEP